MCTHKKKFNNNDTIPFITSMKDFTPTLFSKLMSLCSTHVASIDTGQVHVSCTFFCQCNRRMNLYIPLMEERVVSYILSVMEKRKRKRKHNIIVERHTLMFMHTSCRLNKLCMHNYVTR